MKRAIVIITQLSIFLYTILFFDLYIFSIFLQILQLDPILYLKILIFYTIFFYYFIYLNKNYFQYKIIKKLFYAHSSHNLLIFFFVKLFFINSKQIFLHKNYINDTY